MRLHSLLIRHILSLKFEETKEEERCWAVILSINDHFYALYYYKYVNWKFMILFYESYAPMETRQ